MTGPIPAYAQEAYAILYNRFAFGSFPSSYLFWFISRDMVKKTLHTLKKAGWIKRVGKGEYACISPANIFRSMINFRVPELLQRVGKRYAYADASAVEIWTDYSYIQRSWEHSPYVINILRADLNWWTRYFRAAKVKVFISKPEPSLGEFVVLMPQEKISTVLHNDMPVEPLKAVVKYCEDYIETFEYPLAYLTAKFKVKTKIAIDRRVLKEAVKAV